MRCASDEEHRLPYNSYQNPGGYLANDATRLNRHPTSGWPAPRQSPRDSSLDQDAEFG